MTQARRSSFPILGGATHYHVEAASHISRHAGLNGDFCGFRDALSGDIVSTDTLALGSNGTDEICLIDSCYL